MLQTLYLNSVSMWNVLNISVNKVFYQHFSDDIALITESHEVVKVLLEKLCISSKQMGLIPISSRSIPILSSHLRLGLPKGLLPVGLPVKILKALLPSSILATCPAPIF